MQAQREAETARSQAQREVEEARSHAADEHEARSHAEAAAEAAFRRVEREVAAAEAAQATAQRTADEVVKTTNEGAAALTEAVEALHQWLDGVLVHGSSNGAAMVAAVAATTRGGMASLALRGANAGLHSLQSRMQHVCDEALRLRREAVHREEAIARAEAELRAVQEQWAQSRRRCEKLETALLKADEKVLEGGAAVQKAEAHASARLRPLHARRRPQARSEGQRSSPPAARPLAGGAIVGCTAPLRERRVRRAHAHRRARGHLGVGAPRRRHERPREPLRLLLGREAGRAQGGEWASTARLAMLS